MGCKNYKQTDPRWAKQTYSKTSNMYKAGCGPTSVAIIVSSKDSSITPAKVGKWMEANGCSAPNAGTYWHKIVTGVQHYGMKCTQHNTSVLYGTKDSKAEAEWKKLIKTKKYYGILLMGKGYWTGSGHYIAIVDYDPKKGYKVYDPASTRRTGWHTWGAFDGMVKVFYTIEKYKKPSTTTTSTVAVSKPVATTASKPVTTAKPAASKPAPKPTKTYAVCQSSAVNLRIKKVVNGKTTYADSGKNITKGKKAELLAKDAGTLKIGLRKYTLCKIKYGDKTYYVAQKYFSFTK